MQRCQRERRKRTRIPFAAWAVGGELGRDRVQMGTRPEWRLQPEPRGLRTRGGELPCRPPAACRTVLDWTSGLHLIPSALSDAQGPEGKADRMSLYLLVTSLLSASGFRAMY